jgi:elongation factor G
MSKDVLSRTRNIGIVAHIDAGKTTSTERILFYTGMIHRIGEVDEGTTVTDWMKQERERGITITSAAVSCAWRKHQINIIDTPGHVDFTMEVERCLRVLDGAVGVFCAVGGVEPQSETVWRQADKYRIPKIAFVNKMDRVGANLMRVCRQIEGKFGTKPVLLVLPDKEGPGFGGLADLIDWKFLVFDEDAFGAKVTREEIPESMVSECEKHRKTLLEVVADADEEAMEEYLDTDTIDAGRIRKVLRSLTLKNAIVPILAGSALKNKGIQPLLEAVVDYLPSPLDVPPVVGFTLDGEAPAEPPDPVLGLRLQDPGRRVREPAHLPQGLLGAGEAPGAGHERQQRKEGEARQARAHVCQQEGRAERGHDGRHHGRRGPALDQDGRHALRPGPSPSPREDRVSGPRGLHGHRTQDEGR